MQAEEFEVAGFTFFANFDSGNLGHVRHDVEEEAENGDDQDDEVVLAPAATSRPSTSSVLTRAAGSDRPKYRFSLWTRPDCQGTEFENGNRTWFYFGMKSGEPGSVVQFTVQNLNKQNKLFSQGMAPVFQIGGRTNWERIRDQPDFYVKDGAFYMSFKFRCLEDAGAVVYFAFTYPYTYRELQHTLARMEKKHANGTKEYSALKLLPETGIYLHRELATVTLEGRRLDLVTISGLNGLLPDRELAVSGLFPELSITPRAHKFTDKKVLFLSARVHPGETCSSFVMLGLLKFLLNEKDPRAAALRRNYVFQLLPMLNPDGVVRGHYRTDTRGVNLNRVYSAPNPALHPTIFAARKLILLAHLGRDVIEELPDPEEKRAEAVAHLSFETVEAEEGGGGGGGVASSDTFCDWYKPQSMWQQGRTSLGGRGGRTSTSSRVSNSSRTSSTLSSQLPVISPAKNKEVGQHWYEMTDTSRCSEGDESVADFSIPSLSASCRPPVGDDSACFPPPDSTYTSAGSSRRNSDTCRTSFTGAFRQVPPVTPSKEVNRGQEEEVAPLASFQEEIPLYKPPHGISNVFLYVDIHGHASKRGIFMYGNHFDDLETKVSALMFPKLMTINSANFDFPACNFSQRNMFMKDRHTGAGREGSGRVSIYRATGLTHCYTLECNFNTGRHTNSVPLASRDSGRASPPPLYDLPPRYCPAIYEDCGKHMAISILDLTEANPWTRLPCSSCTTLKGVRQWIKQYIKSAEADAKLAASKTSKASPMRTRLRSLSAAAGHRKPQQVKPLKLAATNIDAAVSLPLSKVPRKAVSGSPRSVGGKLSRQNSRTKAVTAAAKSADTSLGKKKRNSSAAAASKKSSVGTSSRPTSKTSGSRGGSRSGSRASSPRCGGKMEPKITKLGLQKKALQKWKSVVVEEAAVAGAVMPSVESNLHSLKKVKRKKKRIVPTSST